jgi:hypothetical protein
VPLRTDLSPSVIFRKMTEGDVPCFSSSAGAQKKEVFLFKKALLAI